MIAQIAQLRWPEKAERTKLRAVRPEEPDWLEQTPSVGVLSSSIARIQDHIMRRIANTDHKREERKLHLMRLDQQLEALWDVLRIKAAEVELALDDEVRDFRCSEYVDIEMDIIDVYDQKVLAYALLSADNSKNWSDEYAALKVKRKTADVAHAVKLARIAEAKKTGLNAAEEHRKRVDALYAKYRVESLAADEPTSDGAK